MSLITYTGTSANATSAAYNLKPIYTKGVKEQANRTIWAYKLATKNKKKMLGSSYYFDANPMPGGNYVVTTETGEFAAPYHRDMVQGNVSIRGYHGYTLSITKAQTERTKDTDAAFIDQFAQKTKDGYFIMQRNLNRQFYGDGTSALGTLSGASSTTLTVDSAIYPFTTRHFAVGDSVDALVYSSSWAQRGATTYIASITDDTTVVTAAAISGAADNDVMVITGNRTVTSADGREMQGLSSICSTSSTYKNINPSTAGQTFWKAVVNSNSGTARDLDLSYIVSTVQGVQMNTGLDPDTACCSPEMIKPLFDLMSGNIRYTDGEAGKTGFKTPEIYLPNAGGSGIMTLKFVGDRYCPPGQFFIFPSSEIGMLVQMDFQFLDEGKNPVQRIPRTQIYEGQLVFAGEMFTERRDAFALLSDISYTLITSVGNY